MRKIFTLIAAIFLTTTIWAQSPQKMSYQAVIRNASDQLVTTQVGMKISILQGSGSGTAIYVETQTPTPNSNGLVTIEIGGGSPVTGTFTAIDWSAGPYFIKTETDPAGSTNYTITGSSQLLSVPYALHAKTAEGFPALITQDDFSYTAPLKTFWTSAVTGTASIATSNSQVSLSTSSSSGVAKLNSTKQKSVTEGKLIFTAVVATYEDNNTAYGPLTRGLVNGTNRSNAIEFINVSGNTIQARTVSGGTATTTNYAIGASVWNYYSYTIIATKSKVEFYFDGILIATHTTNIPTLPLNMYFDASTWSGNVPHSIDDAKFEIVRN